MIDGKYLVATDASRACRNRDGFYVARSEILPLLVLTPPTPQEDLGGGIQRGLGGGAMWAVYRDIIGV